MVSEPLTKQLSGCRTSKGERGVLIVATLKNDDIET